MPPVRCLAALHPDELAHQLACTLSTTRDLRASAELFLARLASHPEFVASLLTLIKGHPDPLTRKAAATHLAYHLRVRMNVIPASERRLHALALGEMVLADGLCSSLKTHCKHSLEILLEADPGLEEALRAMIGSAGEFSQAGMLGAMLIIQALFSIKASNLLRQVLELSITLC
jgi:hypothetical protein